MSDSCGGGSGELPKKKPRYDNNYEEVPSEFREWLEESAKGDGFIRCKYCKKDIKVTSGQESLMRHATSRSHQSKVNENAVEKTPEELFEDEVKAGEVAFATFIAKQNIPYEAADHLLKLFVDIFPDSNIVKHISFAKVDELAKKLREQGVGRRRQI